MPDPKGVQAVGKAAFTRIDQGTPADWAVIAAQVADDLASLAPGSSQVPDLSKGSTA